jgi:hypothetical protein
MANTKHPGAEGEKVQVKERMVFYADTSTTEDAICTIASSACTLSKAT